MEALHNHITAIIVRYMKNDKVKVSEAILVLDMIRLDLVKQVSEGAYTKRPVKLSAKEPTKLGDKHGV